MSRSRVVGWSSSWSFTEHVENPFRMTDNKHVLPKHMGGGPHGLGDPDDRTLRVVERDVIIPKRMKDRANKEKCADLVKEFTACSKEAGLLMPFTCRKEGRHMKECLVSWYQNPEFHKQVTEDYLAERSEYRRTGIGAKQARKDSATF